MQEREVTVSVWGVPALEKAVKSLARAARRAGISPEPTLIVDWTTKREARQQQTTVVMIEGSIEGESNKIVVVPVVTCRVTLPDGGYKAAGQWRVLAALQRIAPDADTGASQAQSKTTNELFTTPTDRPKAEAWRNAALECEHCKAKRHRSKTLVLEDVTSGAFKQVGKECAAFYLGDQLESAVSALEFQAYVSTLLSDFEPREGFYYGGGGQRTLTAWDAHEVLTHACACVRERGWQPGSIKIPGRWPSYEDRYEANSDATAEHVSMMLVKHPVNVLNAANLTAKIETQTKTLAEFDAEQFPADLDEKSRSMIARAGERWRTELAQLIERRDALLKTPYSVTDPDRERATMILDWLGKQSPDPEKDRYLAELQAVYSPGWVSEARLRFAVSLVRGYENAQRFAEERAKAARSQHVGTINERGEHTLKLTASTPYGGEFPGNAYRFEDAAGNVYSWLTSAGPFVSHDVGKTYVVKATIKGHGEFKGTKQTELTRLKIVRESQADAGNTAPLPTPAGGAPLTNGHAR